MDKKVNSFFSKHVMFTASIHFIGGIGVGAILTYPLFGSHPVRWGLALIIVALLGHLYAYSTKTKK